VRSAVRPRLQGHSRALWACAGRYRCQRRVSRRRGLRTSANRTSLSLTKSASMFPPPERCARRARRSNTMQELGGAAVHARNGVCQFVAAEEPMLPR